MKSEYSIFEWFKRVKSLKSPVFRILCMGSMQSNSIQHIKYYIQYQPVVNKNFAPFEYIKAIINNCSRKAIGFLCVKSQL